MNEQRLIENPRDLECDLISLVFILDTSVVMGRKGGAGGSVLETIRLELETAIGGEAGRRVWTGLAGKRVQLVLVDGGVGCKGECPGVVCRKGVRFRSGFFEPLGKEHFEAQRGFLAVLRSFVSHSTSHLQNSLHTVTFLNYLDSYETTPAAVPPSFYDCYPNGAANCRDPANTATQTLISIFTDETAIHDALTMPPDTDFTHWKQITNLFICSPHPQTPERFYSSPLGSYVTRTCGAVFVPNISERFSIAKSVLNTISLCCSKRFWASEVVVPVAMVDLESHPGFVRMLFHAESKDRNWPIPAGTKLKLLQPPTGFDLETYKKSIPHDVFSYKIHSWADDTPPVTRPPFTPKQTFLVSSANLVFAVLTPEALTVFPPNFTELPAALATNTLTDFAATIPYPMGVALRRVFPESNLKLPRHPPTKAGTVLMDAYSKHMAAFKGGVVELGKKEAVPNNVKNPQESVEVTPPGVDRYRWWETGREGELQEKLTKVRFGEKEGWRAGVRVHLGWERVVRNPAVIPKLEDKYRQGYVDWVNAKGVDRTAAVTHSNLKTALAMHPLNQAHNLPVSIMSDHIHYTPREQAPSALRDPPNAKRPSWLLTSSGDRSKYKKLRIIERYVRSPTPSPSPERSPDGHFVDMQGQGTAWDPVDVDFAD